MHYTRVAASITASARQFIKQPSVTRAFVAGGIITARYSEERDDRALRWARRTKKRTGGVGMSFVARVEYRISSASPRINERLSSRGSP